MPVVQHCSSGSNELLSQNLFRLSVATARGDLHTTQVQTKKHITISIFIQTYRNFTKTSILYFCKTTVQVKGFKISSVSILKYDMDIDYVICFSIL